jgi:urea transport system permease protein
MSSADLSAALSNSLTLGSILILTALGLAITFGVMRVINMAHGEMLMLGAYTAYLVTDAKYLGLNLFVAIPAAFVVVGAVGYLLEVCLIRFLYGRPLDTMLATWGVGLILQQVILLTLGADRNSMTMPPVLSGSVAVGGVDIPVFRLFIVGVTALCLLAVYVWFYRTSFGLKIRAVVQNRSMAAALGISTRRVDSLTFAFGTGLAGVAGCIMAHLYNIKYNMGSDYIVESFMVVILGGLGQLTGCVAAGALIGTCSSFLTKFLGTSWAADLAESVGFTATSWNKMFASNSEAMAKVGALTIIVAFVLVRPSGLFVTRERSYD